MGVSNLLFGVFKRFIRLLSGHGLSRVWPVSVIYRFLFSRLKPDYIEFEGHKISFPKVDTGDISHDISLFNRWGEKREAAAFRKEIKKGDAVVDLGAHIGYYTLLAARLVGPSGKVFAFEPDPENFRCLEKNIAQNGYKNVVSVNKAVSNKTGKTKLFVSNETDNSQIVDPNIGVKSIEVDTTTLDDFFKNQRIDFIKMDIEGSEGMALEGMEKLLTRNKSIKILTEFFPDRLKHAVDARKYLSMLEKHGFKFYDVNKKEGADKPVAKEYLLKAYLVGKQKFEKDRITNLLCIRGQ